VDWVSCTGDIDLPHTPFPPAVSMRSYTTTHYITLFTCIHKYAMKTHSSVVFPDGCSDHLPRERRYIGRHIRIVITLIPVSKGTLSSPYLLTLPLFTGVSCVRALSPAWTGSHARETLISCRYHTSNHLNVCHKPSSLSPINCQSVVNCFIIINTLINLHDPIYL
jgi:hypothetical protein